MIITVIRSGGFAGISREWSVQVDEQPDEDQWRELIDRLPWENSADPAAEPDRYVYRVRCARREAIIPERRLEGPWREIVEKVQVAAQPSRETRPDR